MLGTLIGIGGAMLLTFYKGAEIDIWSTHVNLLHHNGHLASSQPSDSSNHLLGSIFAIGSCVSFALWLVIQVILFQTYYFLLSFSFTK